MKLPSWKLQFDNHASIIYDRPIRVMYVFLHRKKGDHDFSIVMRFLLRISLAFTFRSPICSNQSKCVIFNGHSFQYGIQTNIYKLHQKKQVALLSKDQAIQPCHDFSRCLLQRLGSFLLSPAFSLPIFFLRKLPSNKARILFFFFIYRSRANITCGLYTFCPLFEVQKRFSRVFFLMILA